MQATSARHAQDEVLTGAAFESTGRPSAAAWQKGVDMDPVPEALVRNWEAVYGRYLAAQADRAETARCRRTWRWHGRQSLRFRAWTGGWSPRCGQLLRRSSARPNHSLKRWAGRPNVGASLRPGFARQIAED